MIRRHSYPALAIMAGFWVVVWLFFGLICWGMSLIGEALIGSDRHATYSQSLMIAGVVLVLNYLWDHFVAHRLRRLGQ